MTGGFGTGQPGVPIPTTLTGEEVSATVDITIAGRVYRFDLDPDGITSRGYDPTGLADRIVEAMHCAVWDYSGTMLPDVSGQDAA